jgi:hypothetical protein
VLVEFGTTALRACETGEMGIGHGKRREGILFGSERLWLDEVFPEKEANDG